MTTVLGQIPAPTKMPDVWFPVGVIMPSVLPPEEKEPDGWLLADGGRVSKATYAALYAQLGHAFEGGVDPGDGLFKLPPFVERSGSPARVPIGAGALARGATGGSLGARHGPGTLTLPSHAHNSAYAVADHSHGGSISTTHYHGLYNDQQRLYDINDGDIDAALSILGNNPYFAFTSSPNPGVGGSIYGAGALAISGAAAAAGPYVATGETAAEDPPYTTVYWYVKT